MGYRKALFEGACARRQLSHVEACRQLGASRTHVLFCLAERSTPHGSRRIPSRALAEVLAQFCGVDVDVFWPDLAAHDLDRPRPGRSPTTKPPTELEP